VYNVHVHDVEKISAAKTHNLCVYLSVIVKIVFASSSKTEHISILLGIPTTLQVSYCTITKFRVVAENFPLDSAKVSDRNRF